MIKVYDQGNRGTCGNYSYILALAKLGIEVDIPKVTEIVGLTHPRLEKIFKEAGYIKGTLQLKTPKLVDFWLSKSHYIVIGTSQGNFKNAAVPPYILTQDGDVQHFFCIVEDCGDKWRCQNSWGENWGDKGHFYIMKSEFRSFGTPRRLII